MKRLILAAILVLFAAGVANAAWSFQARIESQADNYLKWSVKCTSDGNALTATDLIALFGNSRTKQLIRGTSLLMMKVSPGTASVAPDNTFDIQLEDLENDDIWSDTGISYTAISWHQLWDDIETYPTVFSELNLVVSDIGASGDQITLYFICWVENP